MHLDLSSLERAIASLNNSLQVMNAETTALLDNSVQDVIQEQLHNRSGGARGEDA